MISFMNDYSEGAHFNIIKRLVETDMEQAGGYCSDQYCKEAKDRIKAAIGTEAGDVDVEFLVGGTQTNMIMISTMLKPYQGVVSAKTGHIATHEAGAIEHSGHKVLELPPHDGKLDPMDVAKYLDTFYGDEAHDHMVFPGMIFISHPSELGTLYTKEELKAFRMICDKFGMKLYLDGARLGYGLASKGTDVTLKDIAQYCDAFYIGGTKVGALIGEAAVFMRGCKPEHFDTQIKQKGALLAKGRILGIQFAELFKDDLYMKISKHAIDMAVILKAAFVEKGYPMYIDSPTNQQFFILPDAKLDELAKDFKFARWEKIDETHSAVRFCTSWATKKENIEKLAAAL